MRQFSSAFLERTSEVFKAITTNQNMNQELLTKSLEQERNQNTKIINSLKAIENKPDIVKAEDIKEEDFHCVHRTECPHHEYNGTLSKI